MLRDLVDRQAIVDTVVRWAQALDAKDWVAARPCFADEIETDYTDLRGTGPTRVRAEAFVHRLDPSRETDNTFDTAAHYTLARTPQGWRITRIRRSVAWSRGNPAIHTGARPGRDGEERGSVGA